MKFRSAFWVLLIFPISSVAIQASKPPIIWETGKVVAQDLGSAAAGSYTAPVGTATVAVPLYRRWNVVTVETGNYRYRWQEAGSGPPLLMTVNDAVRFYRDGSWFIVLDVKNKKHKFGAIAASKID